MHNDEDSFRNIKEVWFQIYLTHKDRTAKSTMSCYVCLWTPHCGLLRPWGRTNSFIQKEWWFANQENMIFTHMFPWRADHPFGACAVLDSIRNVCYAKEWLPSQVPTRDTHFPPLIAQIASFVTVHTDETLYSSSAPGLYFMDAVLSIVPPSCASELLVLIKWSKSTAVSVKHMFTGSVLSPLFYSHIVLSLPCAPSANLLLAFINLVVLEQPAEYQLILCSWSPQVTFMFLSRLLAGEQ